MPNPIFSRIAGANKAPAENNNMMNVFNSIKAMAQGNVQGMAQMMMNSNPQFAQFVSQNQGKSFEQIASENGIDVNQLKSILNR